MLKQIGLVAIAALLLVACVGGENDSDKSDTAAINLNPYPSTYTPRASDTVLITNASIFDGLGNQIDGGSVLLENGRITAIGADIVAPDGANTINAQGKWMTPGIIDNHSHLGVYAAPGVEAHADGNEITAPVTAEVWAEHGVCLLYTSPSPRD